MCMDKSQDGSGPGKRNNTGHRCVWISHKTEVDMVRETIKVIDVYG